MGKNNYYVSFTQNRFKDNGIRQHQLMNLRFNSLQVVVDRKWPNMIRTLSNGYKILGSPPLGPVQSRLHTQIIIDQTV